MKKAIEILQKAYPDSSNATLTKWVKFGRVEINGQRIKRKDTLFKEDSSVRILKKTLNPFDFPVLYEDEHIIVVHKPDFLLSVDSLDPKERSVHADLKKHFKPKVIYPLHRLDRNVTGPLIFAKTQKANELLKEAFYDRRVHREYRALVHGEMECDEGTWETTLEEGSGYKMRVTEDTGKHAITHYEVLQKNKRASLLKLKLDTGRKNQLRIHTAHASHPIFGDDKYGTPDSARKIALYACSLQFEHPITGKSLEFHVRAPKSFWQLAQNLRLPV